MSAHVPDPTVTPLFLIAAAAAAILILILVMHGSGGRDEDHARILDTLGS